MSDSLQKLFNMQERLMRELRERERFNGSPDVTEQDYGKLNSRLIQNRLHEIYGYLVRELSEAMQHLTLKPWKNNGDKVNAIQFDEELIDALHFLLELMITAGMDADYVMAVYEKKMVINRQRWQSGTY